jgi:hypothetical protein
VPPYIVFRYEAGTWVRIPLAELRPRIERMNLITNPDRDSLKANGYFIRCAVTAQAYRDIPGADNHALLAAVDRRLRNPLGLGCSRDAIERNYGVEKYDEWRRTGNWLDKSDDEVRRLLRRNGEGAKP